ncbi:RNase H1/viroplasmin domain-containing protein (plasmid) [Aneurinibacillus sp. Ricciae_BoGa-3]|uniref:RNase H1/viroplasmin domain-containing protein n=1 Tax=Aneurinibacillus sp. Ricciae_BoGa-3 TaxID=3022697 RepID=UPI002340DF44|nr:RNase H1/viroplasmin domain-containing protein [Aneurinibacillus sp. Ricciae_BoGa-3]WCK57358.1 RNase H1/viroplasmin domain-containing protein [Aneurinibacillus sp. Ricciae_BoGa-3]
MKKRFYSIRKGYRTGVFYGYWQDVQKHVDGFSNAQFKGFDKIEDAEKFLNGGKNKTRAIMIQTEQSKVKSEKKSLSKKKEQKVSLNREEVLNKRTELTQQIIYSEELHNHYPKVSIVLLGHQYVLQEHKPGFFEYILIHDKTGVALKNESYMMPNTSPNRAIIIGLMDALSLIKPSCHIKVYTKISIGFKKMIKGSGGPNQDVLNELKEYLLSNVHVVQEFVDIQKVEELYAFHQVNSINDIIYR